MKIIHEVFKIGIGLNQPMKCQISFLGQPVPLSHLMCLAILVAFDLYDTEQKQHFHETEDPCLSSLE